MFGIEKLGIQRFKVTSFGTVESGGCSQPGFPFSPRP